MLGFDMDDGERDCLVEADVVHPVVVRVVAEAWVGGGTGASGTGAQAVVTCVGETPAGVLVGTSAGDLACVAWDGGAVLWRSHLPELLRKGEGLKKLGVLRGGIEEGGVREILEAQGADDGGGVVAIAFDASLGFCGVVLGNGCAFLLSVRRQGGAPPSAVDGRWLISSGAASITLESRRMLATLGLESSDVEHYYVGVPAGDLCPVMRKLSLASWYFDPTDVGAAKSVSWTKDGGALLVGWEKRGLAVWSVSGCRLMWTLPQVGGILPSTPGGVVTDDGGGDEKSSFPSSSSGSSSFSYPMDQGVASATWGPEGLFLWAAPRVTDQSPSVVRECAFMEFNFFKSTTGATCCQSEASRLAMVGSDRILLLASSDGYVPSSGSSLASAAGPDIRNATGVGGDGGGGGEASKAEYSWQHILIPHDYLWRNWPPTRVAVSDDANYIAVAGEYGVGICSLRSQRWRVFGDVAHDARRIKCCALAWVGSSIVIGNEAEVPSTRRGLAAKSTFELLVFPRDQIESSAVRARKLLTTRPVIIDVRSDGYMLIIGEDSSVVLYKLTEMYGGSSIDMREVYRVFLPTRETIVVPSPPVTPTKGTSLGEAPLPSPGGGISVARIFPPLDHAGPGVGSDGKQAPIPTQMMLLRSSGSLVMLDVKHMLSVPLLRYVEHFWYSSAIEPPFEKKAHRPVWWAYGDDGTHVCFRDGMRRFLAPSSSETALQPFSSENGGLDVAGAERLAAMSPLAEKVNTRLRSSSSSRSSGIGVEQWFELDPEVYPLGIMSKQGMLLGASQGLLANSVAMDGYEIPSHIIQVKRQPVLHMLLRHLLMKPVSDDRMALQVALKCSRQPQFVDSLEWLLYEAVMEFSSESSDGAGTARTSGGAGTKVKQTPAASLNVGGRGAVGKLDIASLTEKSAPARSASSRTGDLFPRVIAVLKYFGEYEDIVVRCARKMDSKRWPVLFAEAGDPLALIDQCFASGRLRTAACLLVILQEMCGFASSTPQSLRLVSAALECDEIGLAGDLANFLGKASRAGMLDAEQLTVSVDVSWIGEEAYRGLRKRRSSSTPGSPAPLLGRRLSSALYSGDVGDGQGRIPAVDLAVLKCAERLLRGMEVRKLASLSIRLDFPLAAWLGREVGARAGNGKSSILFVDNFETVLLRLHRQFQYSEPSKSAVRRAMENVFVPSVDAEDVYSLFGVNGTPNVEESGVSDDSSAATVGGAGREATRSGEGRLADRDDRALFGGGRALRGRGRNEEWGRVEVDSPRTFVARANRTMAGRGADTLFGSELPPPPSSNESLVVAGMRAKARHLCRQELIYLRSVADAAGAVDLAVAFAVLLLDVGFLVETLQYRTELRVALLGALRGMETDGYDALADTIHAYISDDGGSDDMGGGV